MQVKRHLFSLLFFSTFFFTSLMAENLTLKSGWNLVGLDVNMSLADFQAKVGTDNLEVLQGPVKTYQKKYITLDLAFLNDFTAFEKGVGYWVQLQNAVTIEYTPETYVGEASTALNAGWNLVNPLANFTLEEIIAQLGVENILVIQGSVKTYQKHYVDDNKSFLNDFTAFETGHGYWIKLLEPATLHYVFDLTQQALDNTGTLVSYDMTLGSNVYAIQLYTSQAPTSTNSQSTIAVYGTLNGESTGSNIKLNNTYPTDTQFQIKVFDSNGTLRTQSAILPYNADAINFGALVVDNTIVEPPETAESKYHDVLGLSLKFYEAQRAVGPFPTVDWRKPASTNDGADVGVDLNGGWFDAGDHVKFNLPMSYSVGMLNWSLIANEEAYTQAGKLAYGKDQVKYALDYLLNTYQAGANLDSPDDDKVYFQVADGHVDHGFWGPPEELNMERKTFVCDADGGCAAVSGSMVGAFASGAMVFKDDSAYSQKLLENAKRLYKFAMKYQTDLDYSSVGQDFYALYQNTHNEDQLAWGAIWLYKATNETQYLTDAKNIMSGIYPWSGHSWDNMALGVFTLLTELTNDNSYGTLVETELDKWVNKDIPTSAGGLRVLQQWGSLRYASTSAYIALMYSDLLSDGAKKEGYIGFAKSQIDYILGENPRSFSYVVGYGENYPLQPHHRAASGTTELDPNPNKYLIEGALVGGPKSASDTDYIDSRSSYIDNEVATDYNAGFTGALAKLALIYGEPTTPKTDSESVALDKVALTFDRIKNQNSVADDVQSNLTLVTQGSFDTTIAWSSNNTNVISNLGVVQRQERDVTVILTATITKGMVSDTKTFTLIVTKEAVQEGACQVDYHVRDEWGTGATIDVTVTNQIANLYGWEVSFTFPSGQTINNLWNGIKTQTDNFVSVLNESYNAQINQGQKIEFGFVLNHNGKNDIPTDIRLNGKLCDGQIGGITKPAKPTNLLAELISNSQVTLTWDDNSDNEDNFLVYKSVDLNSWELLATLEVNSTIYQDKELEVGHTYEYKVEAKNIAGKTESEKVSVTPNMIYVQENVDNKAVSLVANCVTCHRSSNSDSSIPMIHGLSRDHLEKTLQGYQSGEHFSYAMNRIMDGYSSDEIELMMEYFASHPWVGNSIVSYDIDTINQGKTLYESNCIACHGEDGTKEKIMLSGQSEQYLVDTMTQYAKGLHTNGNEGMLSTFTDTIGQDASKIEALAKYLAVGLKIPEGDNDTIRGFDAYYQNSTNTIVLSWDYINPETERLEVMLNDSVVQTITDFGSNSVTLLNDGSSNFVIGQTYALKIKTIHGSTQMLSRQILVEVLSDESKGQEHYNSQCKVCHGVNGTQRDDITDWNPVDHTFAQFTRGSSMDEMYYSGCDDACLELIGVYVQNVLAPRARDNNNSNNAEDVNSDLQRGYRLLNRVEYTNTLYSLFEIDNDELRAETLALHYTDLPTDNIVEGYNTDREMTRMDEDKVRALNLMASKVENYLESLKGKNGSSCWIGDYNFCTADKDAFLDGFATKIFRRPLTTVEKSAYMSLESVAKMVGDMLVSPKFLYRSEMGAVTDQSGVYQLTQYEIATALAYTMAGTTPDSELLSLASEVKLLDANTRVTQAVRLAQLQTGKDKLDDFIGRWLLEESVYSLSDKNPERFVGYTPEVREAQSTQVLKFFRMVMEDTEKSSYKDLFVNDKMVTNKTLSDYYAEGTSSSSEFETIPATDKRYGILTLGAVASKYANSEEAHPFKRGKFVLARLMCHPMGPPGNGGDVPAVEDHTGENKRDRYSNHVNDPSCAACHHLLDPIGFTWENYDGTGRYRTSEYHPAEHGGPKPIDASVTLKGLLTFDTSETHSSEGIGDVSALIAESDRGPECMALQYYRYTSGDSHADIENSRVVKKIASDFKAENYDLQGLFTNIVKLNSFITRVGE
ncbi:glycoside hydrolase family 9 protein [bacterium]|nr:glycoside hydrolase family 9 protein [bacterium]MBU1957429.1 glycoside hydrolase family 9 protein [bacterium]